MDKLGAHTYTAMLAIKAKLDVADCRRLTGEIIDGILMTPAHESVVFTYPYNGAGNGFIYIQPIIESFISWDVWKDPEGAYLTICSCKAFSMIPIMDILKTEGLEILELTESAMGLR